MISSKWVLGDQGIEDALSVRRRVFIEEQHVPENEEFDAMDARALHLMLYEGEKCVATGRLYFYEGVYHAGRIAVRKEERGKYMGDLVVRLLLFKAFQQGAESVEIGAQTYAVPFYERFGFVKYGEEYLDCDIPHFHMRVTEDTLRMEGECGHDCTNCVKKKENGSC